MTQEPTPRELVHRTLRFEDPPRLPRQLWVLPWATMYHPEALRRIQARFPDDIVSAPACLRRPLQVSGDRHARGIYLDEWGCTFVNLQDGVIGEVKAPLVADWGDLDRVRIPEERLSVDVAEVNAFCRQTDRYVLAGTCPRPFEQLQFLRGTEAVLLDLLERPPELAELLGRLHALYLEELQVWARTDVDALYVMDDWGAQRSMLVAPALWRELFAPLYQEYVEIAHGAGKAIFMHSDGWILEIMEDLVTMGLDALNCQVFCMGLDRVGERCAGRLTFWGELDRQQLLPFGTTEEVAAAARQMRTALHRRGGLIAQCEFGAGARPDNIVAFLEALQP